MGGDEIAGGEKNFSMDPSMAWVLRGHTGGRAAVCCAVFGGTKVRWQIGP